MRKTHVPLLLLAAMGGLALAGCDGAEDAPGNTVEMRDMNVLEGTVNDSMTDLDAVKADGLGAVGNAGSVSRKQTSEPAANASSEDTETVASE
ncbi:MULTISPECIES: hypothetical protein [unclassified Sphingobium]|uniref:hypothetical protein n=1 Tax=unclassified Sphingobium TaxID=2611147 RepID=UPI0022244519|nr:MULTISPECIES: hypothetical protein [unclassified Sphingobium]MCW2411163.1 hypothetical protein [Sphingobium sp. B8D3D]MCW2416545.1 hypothetical protein [Sphingobium sp. B8D3A]